MILLYGKEELKMKMILGALLALALSFAAVGCGTSASDEPTGTGSTSGIETETSSSSSGEAAEAVPSGDSSVLVVYFSGSGGTKGIAEMIASDTGGNLFELVPTEPYSEEDLNWREETSRVNKEHEDPSLQNIELTQTSVDGWDKYDTVFIGYPIWWRDAAWPVRGFVTANDFTGKTVIPFCTSSSSQIGESGSNLAQLAGTGNWLPGERFPAGASESEVSEWVESLNLE